jgi:hypothetical protein
LYFLIRTFFFIELGWRIKELVTVKINLLEVVAIVAAEIALRIVYKNKYKIRTIYDIKKYSAFIKLKLIYALIISEKLP